jgi:4-hydroxy-3-polyprenylbenzoate decarboxylase
MDDTVASDVARRSATSHAGTRWKDLREWLALADAHGSLHRIDAEVDPKEELAALTFMATRTKDSPALLFERFADNPLGARVLSNMLGASKVRYALAVGLDPELSIPELVDATRQITKQRIAPVWVSPADAPVNEVVLRGDEIDLTRLPVPTFWPRDGGPFIGTGGITITANPAGRLNVGCYRQQLHSARRIGLNFVPGRHGETDCEAVWAAGKPCEIVAAFGIDPALFMVGGMRFGRNESEIDAAGGIMGRPVELTKAECVSLPIPAQAEIVIEGLVHPGDLEMEGPLGEFHGFYSGKASRKPVIEVKALHYRKSPIITAALMATYPSCEIGEYQAIMRAARILDDLDRIGLPGVKGAYCHPAAASGNCLAVVAIEQMYPGHAAQALALTAQCPTATYYTKWIGVVDADVDPTNFDEVVWALSTRCNPSADLDILRNTMSFRADPSLAPEAKPYGSRVLINACTPFRYIAQSPVRTLLRRDTYARVARRWSEFKMPGRPPALTHFYDESSATQDGGG